jgi:hypothetical protein
MLCLDRLRKRQLSGIEFSTLSIAYWHEGESGVALFPARKQPIRTLKKVQAPESN